jgi:drug/metabolite transporter (DMT)-like permease
MLRKELWMVLAVDGLDPATLTAILGVLFGLVYGLATIFFLSDLIPRRDLTLAAKVFWGWAIVGGFLIGIVAYYFMVYRKGK